jgi:hypothetical protein
MDLIAKSIYLEKMKRATKKTGCHRQVAPALSTTTDSNLAGKEKKRNT